MIKLKSLLCEGFERYKHGEWIHYNDVDFIKPVLGDMSCSACDPYGIYLFPASIDIGYKMKQYWKQKKNKIYVKISSNLNVFDFSNISADTIKNSGITIDDIKKDMEYVKKLFPGKSPTLRRIWWKLLLRKMGRKELTNFFLSLGYDAIFDDTNTIQLGEIQLIILNPDDIQILKIEPNDL